MPVSRAFRYLSVLVVAATFAGCQSSPASAPAQAAAASTGTEILWDKFGVPHIFAPDHASLFKAYGYAQMEAHAELLVRLYAQARGRGAEYYGPQYLESDKWVRTNGLYDTAKQWATSQSADFAPFIESFAKGLNQWADEHKGELSAEAKSVLPLTPVDVYAHGLRVIHYDWIVSQRRLEGRLDRWEDEAHGSNEWAISSSRSATGHAFLMSNSHLQWGDIHTYFEVQLTAPGVTSYGAVWVGFPVLRQCFTEYVGWTQTTNTPSESDLYGLVVKGDGYVLDGQVKPFDTHTETLKIKQADGSVKEAPLVIRRSVHGPVVAERKGMPIAMRVVGLDRPKMFEQFWRMGLAKNLKEWEDAMRMAQLPLFNTAYADRDGHIGYVYNATIWKHDTGNYRFWQGVVPGDKSELIATEVHPYETMPKVFDPPTGWVQNSNDMPWTSTYPMTLDPAKFPAGYAAPQGITQRSQRGIRILSTAPEKMTFEDVKKGKLSTHVETADDFVDEIVATAKAQGTPRAKKAADVLAKWDRQAEVDSDGMLLFYKFMTAAGNSFKEIGGFKVPTDDKRPLETPRGFRDPAKAMAMLDKVAGDVEKEYGTLAVKWGDVLRFRRGNTDVPGNGAPSQLGAIRTINVSDFKDGKVEAVSGDTFYAVIEYSVPQRAEALLNYGNWSKKGSKHIDDQLPLASRKELRPVWRTKAEIEANLESRKTLN